MKYNTYTLPNGLRIIHLPSASPVVYCGYEINAGTRDELPGEEGLAHFCEHNTFKGTEHRRAWHILNCLETVGGDLNAYTCKGDTVYYAAILHEHLPRAIDLLTDIIFHSVYPQSEINKEVEVICDEIESYNDSPSDLIFDEFENVVFSGHPLGHNILGKADQLRTYTTDDAKRFTSKFYKPCNSVFFAYGDVDFKKMVRTLEKATSDIPYIKGESELSAAKRPAAGLPEYKPQEIIRDLNTHQAHVMIGNRTFSRDDKRRIPLYLVNNILGGPGMNARLNLSLRERHGLVYTVESNTTTFGDTGIWSVYFGCDPHDVPHCRRLVRKELDRMMQTPLTTTQLNAAKKQIKGQIGVSADNRESFALDFGKSYLHYGWQKDISDLFRRIDLVTPEEMQQVAQDIFAEDQLTTLIFK